MKEVKIVTLSAKAHFIRDSFDEVDEIIKDMYQKGYEFKGSVISSSVGYGAVHEQKLVFDKEL